MFSFLYPGQGSQQTGMGKFLFESFSEARSIFEEASDALSLDIKKLCFEGSSADLSLTENTQPCLLTVSTAVSQVLKNQFGVKTKACAGHSVGEYAALVCGEVLKFADAVRAVRRRGQAMQSAVPIGLGGMAAVIGLEDQDVITLCKYVEEKSKQTPLNPANFNCPGQVVVSGSKAAVDFLVSSTKAEDVFGPGKTFKIMPLKVSAPFHCAMMLPAEKEMANFLSEISFQDSTLPIVQNKTAAAHTHKDEIKKNLIAQISAPVLWTQSMKYLAKMGETKFIECGSGKVLQGLAKKIDSQSFQVFNTNNLDDLKLIETAVKAN